MQTGSWLAISAFDFSGRVALVTGAASGLSQQCAWELAAAGAVVVCVDRAPLDATLRRQAELGGQLHPHVADVTERAEVDGAIEHAVQVGGKLDILVNGAGALLRKSVLEVVDDELEHLLAVNFKGTLLACQAAARIMKQQRDGSIVNLASAAIDQPSHGVALYGAAKAAVRQVTRSLALELAEYKIRVNCVAPGWVQTAMTEAAFTDGAGEIDSAALRRRIRELESQIPLGRVGQAQDVAYAVLYLASAASAWMTGQTLRPNGGVAMPW